MSTSIMSTEHREAPHCKVIQAGTIAKTLQAEVSEGVKKLSKPPHLVGFLATDDPAAKAYADWTAKTAKDKYVLYI
jgi:methylenetetrahydrofolate dehydrogenase (NAD+)